MRTKGLAHVWLNGPLDAQTNERAYMRTIGWGGASALTDGWTARVLVKDHPDTLTALGNWAMSLGDLGRTAEAEPMEKRVFEASERTFGKDHLL